MTAYFTEAAAVAAQLAGTTRQGRSQSQRKNKQRQSARCLWTPLNVKSLKHRLRLQSLPSLLGSAGSDVTALPRKQTEGKAI